MARSPTKSSYLIKGSPLKSPRSGSKPQKAEWRSISGRNNFATIVCYGVFNRTTPSPHNLTQAQAGRCAGSIHSPQELLPCQSKLSNPKSATKFSKKAKSPPANKTTTPTSQCTNMIHTHRSILSSLISIVANRRKSSLIAAIVAKQRSRSC